MNIRHLTEHIITTEQITRYGRCSFLVPLLSERGTRPVKFGFKHVGP